MQLYPSVLVRKIILVAASVGFATAVLIVSIIRTTAPNYVFAQKLQINTANRFNYGPVDYFLAYPGVLPDNKLWQLKAVRDYFWLAVTQDSIKRSELLLLFADKRINAAYALLEAKNPGLAVTTAQKAEQYLMQASVQEQIAREHNKDTIRLLQNLALAALKHREVLEEMYLVAPEEARPMISETITYPKRTFNEIKVKLLYLHQSVPESPFEP